MSPRNINVSFQAPGNQNHIHGRVGRHPLNIKARFAEDSAQRRFARHCTQRAGHAAIISCWFIRAWRERVSGRL